MISGIDAESNVLIIIRGAYSARSPDFLRCLDILCVSSFVLEGVEEEEEEAERGSIRATTKRICVRVCSSAKREFSIRIRVLILRVVIL